MSGLTGSESGTSLDDSLTNIQWLCKLESNEILEGSKNKRKQMKVHAPEREEPRNPHPKPPYSYASLIVFAINSAPEKKMTLKSIYSWIEQQFPFYKYAKKGWKNSIRHNLSLHRFFIKEKRPSSLTGKGSFWSILPGSKENVMREIMKRSSSNSVPYSCQTTGNHRSGATLRPLLPKPNPLGETAANTVNIMSQNKIVGNSPIYIPAGTPIVFVPTPMYVQNPQHLKSSDEKRSTTMPSPVILMGGNLNASSTPIQSNSSLNCTSTRFNSHILTSSPSTEVAGHSHVAILRKSVIHKIKSESPFQEFDSGIGLSPKKPRMADANSQTRNSIKSRNTKEKVQPTLAEINTSKDFSGFSPEKYKDFLNNLSFMSSPNRTDNLIVTPSKKCSFQNGHTSPNNWLSPLQSVFKGLTPTKTDLGNGIFTPLKDQKDELHEFSFNGLTPFMSNTPTQFFESPLVSKSTKKNTKGCRKALISDDKVEGEIFLKPLPELFIDGNEGKS